MPTLTRPTRLSPEKAPAAVEACEGYRLAEAIISLSVAETWDLAKQEWALATVWVTDEPGVCLCGHRPIFEHCQLVNLSNGNLAVVGNVCVTRFLGLPSDKLFAALNRIADDPRRALNADAIAFAHDRGWLNDWERDFYLDTWRKRKLSPRQLAKREQINAKVFDACQRIPAAEAADV